MKNDSQIDNNPNPYIISNRLNLFLDNYVFQNYFETKKSSKVSHIILSNKYAKTLEALLNIVNTIYILILHKITSIIKILK